MQNMVELKILDADSLVRIVEILAKNGYKVSTHVILKNSKMLDIDYFTVRIDGADNG